MVVVLFQCLFFLLLLLLSSFFGEAAQRVMEFDTFTTEDTHTKKKQRFFCCCCTLFSEGLVREFGLSEAALCAQYRAKTKKARKKWLTVVFPSVRCSPNK